MARKPNYEFHKRRKELDRKAENEEKLRRKREKRLSEQTESVADAPPAAPPAEDQSLPSDR